MPHINKKTFNLINEVIQFEGQQEKLSEFLKKLIILICYNLFQTPKAQRPLVDNFKLYQTKNLESSSNKLLMANWPPTNYENNRW